MAAITNATKTPAAGNLPALFFSGSASVLILGIFSGNGTSGQTFSVAAVQDCPLKIE
jgi:hypothetical protein